jgi:hypothetical protein
MSRVYKIMIFTLIAIILSSVIFVCAMESKKFGTIKCYLPYGKLYLEDEWVGEVTSNKCSFSYVSKSNGKKITVTGQCVITEEW